MVMKFTNNAATTLAAGITNVATTLTVLTGSGSLFPTLGASDYFYCTLANLAGAVEIVKVTARSSDTFTIVRGQDGTSAQAWNTSDKVELRLVAAVLNDVPKLDEANIFTGLNQINSLNTFGFKNRIINGAMVIDQRNAGAASSNAINGFFVDRWFVAQTTSGKLIAQQNAGAVTLPAGFATYLGVTSQSAYSVGAGDFYVIGQPIEANNVSDFGWGTANAQTVTLSFQVRSSLTGTFGGVVKNYAGTRSYPFTYTINAANTWEQKTITISGDTSGSWVMNGNGGSIYVQFGLGVGATYSGAAGSWATANYQSATGATSVVGTSGATFYITGVQLEKGSTATSFDYRPYGTELALCQRYFWQVSDSGNAAGFCNVSYFSTTRCFGVGSLPVQMRAIPTLSTSAAATFNTLTITAQNASAITLYNATVNAFTLDITTGVTTAGFAGYLRSAAASTAILSFSSEL